jgi:hypothetical protein
MFCNGLAFEPLNSHFIFALWSGQCTVKQAATRIKWVGERLTGAASVGQRRKAAEGGQWEAGGQWETGSRKRRAVATRGLAKWPDGQDVQARTAAPR